MKRRIILSTLLILIVICTMIGMSYAYYQLKLTDTHELITKTEIPSCFSLSLNSDSQITLNGDQSAPVSDIKALGSSNYQYSFSVSNGCANTSSVKVALTPSLDTDMPIRAIKYAVYEQNGTKPSEGTYLIDAPAQKLTKDIVGEVKEQSQIDVETGYQVLSLELSANQTKDYYLYIWIDYYEGDKSQTGVYNNSTMNKTFTGSLVITNYEDLGEYIEAYAIYSNTDNSLIFYKNYDKPAVGDMYNGKTVTAIYKGFETEEYAYDENTATPSTPWYEYASVIKKVSVVDTITPVSTACWFFRFENAENIDLNNLDTSQATTMLRMLDRAGYLSSNFELSLGNEFDTSNVTNMKAMFQYTGYTDVDFTLDLGSKFDTSNVLNMGSLFNCLGRSNPNFEFSLGNKFDTSKVTDMSYMFQGLGNDGTIFTLDLGLMFDTSKVTTMNRMFNQTGYASKIFKLDLGDKFDTLNVTDMSYMFRSCGYSSDLFKLDLGDKFNTSKVTTMEEMFHYTGRYAASFELDLGENFDTSSVTNMTNMFARAGRISPLFKLDLGDKFDTSNVTNMNGMFMEIALAAPNFTLDLGNKFDTSKVWNMGFIFHMCGHGNTSFKLELGSKFDTSNVIYMQNAFSQLGQANPNFTLDLGSKFDTSKVTNMNSMFYLTGNANPNFVLDVSDFEVKSDCSLTNFAYHSASTIIFGEGWANATLVSGMFIWSWESPIATTVVNAPANLQAYDWTSDNRAVTFTTV